MPYKSKEKAREASKDRMRRMRGRNRGVTGCNEGEVTPSPSPEAKGVTGVTTTGVTGRNIPGLVMDGNRIVGVDRQVSGSLVTEAAPWYNPAIHRPGDTVRVRDFKGRAKVITVPELDADGNPMA